MIYVTRRETFNAAHKLHRPEWTEEQNEAVFGKCSNPNWHGHNYVLYITVAGRVDPETGFLMDAKQLSKLVKKHVIDDLDHRNMNLDVPWMKGVLPSSENILIKIWERIDSVLNVPNARLYSLKLQETENIFAEYYGPNGR